MRPAYTPSPRLLRGAISALLALLLGSGPALAQTSTRLDDSNKLQLERARAQLLAMKLGGTGFEKPKVVIPTAQSGCNMQIGPAAPATGARGLLKTSNTTYVAGTTICLNR